MREAKVSPSPSSNGTSVTANSSNTENTGPRHIATYARDKRKGGYLIRVAGPYPEKFSGRTVPVTMKDHSVHSEELDALIWTGLDEETGVKVALYSFIPKPREDKTDEIPF